MTLRKHKHTKVDFDQFVKVFNEEGKSAAIKFIEVEYDSSYPVIQRKLRKESNYMFNKNTRKYELKTDSQATFMTIEELCEGKAKANRPVEKTIVENPTIEIISDDFRNLMLNLLKDKMQEINKYIYLEQSTNQIIINLKKLEASGYNIVLN